MSTPGAYALLVRLDTPADLEIGRLGPFFFEAGFYLYAGSALRGLEQRVARHLRPSAAKRLHWHIDYLLAAGQVVAVWQQPGRQRRECACAQAAAGLPGARLAVRRFGSSDCGCPGHLVYLGEEVDQAAVQRCLRR